MSAPDLLACVNEAMTRFLAGEGWARPLEVLLRFALRETGSEYGFAGVLVDGPVLRILAHQGMSWHPEINRAFFDGAIRTYEREGYLEFGTFDNLFGQVVRTGKVVVSNDPANDPRSGGLPPGHPAMHSFLGVPILSGPDLVGIMGVANRAGGYRGAEQAVLETLIQQAGVLCDSYRRREEATRLERERSEAEVAMQASEARLRERCDELDALYATAPVGLSMVDGDLRYLRTNERMAQINGLSVAAHVGRRVGEVLPELAAPVERALSRVFATGQPVADLEIRGATGALAGVVRDWLTGFYPVRDREGRVAAASFMMLDITARRQAERQLAHERAVLERLARDETLGEVLDTLARGHQDLFPGTLVSVLLSDPDGKTLRHGAAPSLPSEYCRAIDGVSVGPNVGSCGTAAFTRETVIVTDIAGDPRWKDYRDLALAHDLRACWSTPVLSTQGAVLGTFAMYYREPRAPRAQELEASASSARLAAVAIEHQRGEEALRLSEERSRQSQKMEALGLLAGGIAHDFNNLLTVLLGRTELLLARLGPDDPLRGEIALIEQTGDRAAALTRQLLIFGRRQILEPQVVDFNCAIRDMHEMLRRMVREDIGIDDRLDPGLAAVKVDRSQLEQVIMNLVVNACDAMPAGGSIVIETRNATIDDAFVRAHPYAKKGEYVLLTVADTGSGMDPATLGRVFEPFFTTKPAGRGTGLGLSTVYAIVKQSGGYVEVESEPGQGSRFQVFLPTTTEAAPERAVAIDGPASLPSASATILVVEDEEGIRELLREVLVGEGYLVRVARNGREAVRLFEADEGVDLVLTDVVMPEMGGTELVDRLTRSRPDLKYVFMSGYAETMVTAPGGPAPGATLIQKPFTPANLVHTIAAKLRA